jgi:hypothetical protein
MSVFLKLWDKADVERSMLEACDSNSRSAVYRIDPQKFRTLPGSPFAYWAPDHLFDVFSLDGLEDSESGVIVRIGLTTHDDFRWLRLSWETSDPSFVPFAKGGSYSKWYSDLPLCLRWHPSGSLLKASKLERSRLGELTENNSKCWNESHYFRPGLTWPRRTAGFSVRALPAQAIFGDKGPAIFAEGDDWGALLAVVAVLNSAPFELLLRLMIARNELAQSYEVGVIRNSPIPIIPPATRGRLAKLAQDGWSARRSLDTAAEGSHAFLLPSALQVDGSSFDERIGAWSALVRATEMRLSEVQADVDEICFGLYGISTEDPESVVAALGTNEAASDQPSRSGDSEDLGETMDWTASARPFAAGLVSWAVGTAVGRFDVRLATGERRLASNPHPFDPLPLCAPAMLSGDDGLPLVTLPVGYSINVSPILVSDPGHPLDITTRVRSVFEVVFGPGADVWWVDVGGALAGRGGDVGTWLGKGFFDSHLKDYSKSRRKAPVLWPLGTRSGSYLVWLYAHRVTTDSLFQALHDVVAPKVALEEQRLTRLRQDVGPSPTASQRRAVEQHVAFVDELRELAETIESVAPLWSPDLNDGIVIVLAPLWRLFAHHRAWSKELKSHWTKLVAGDYDWAQLAMHLWPERVILKCAEDRSLAIAHGLDDVFWVQDDSGAEKWHARKLPTTSVEQLIAERHNPAVVAALAGQP